MNHLYTLYDLTLSVPFFCPMLPPASTDSTPDIIVAEGAVSGLLDDKKAEGLNWQAAPGRFLLRGGRYAGRFLVENGTQITVEKNSEADDKKLAAFLSTSIIVALLRQRGQVVLHASTVVTPQGAVAISGQSGAGKSTTQAALLNHNCHMLTDDITVLGLKQHGKITVLPGIPKMNLCEDTAFKLGYDIYNLPRNPLRRAKVIVTTVQDKMTTAPSFLKALYVLSCHREDKILITTLSGTEKFAAIQECIYGPLFPEEHLGIFSFLAALTEQIKVIRIARPEAGWSLDAVLEAIIHG